jgi:predicted small metal-binding protein
MLKFACKDLGIQCDFVATGATKDEVLRKAMQHGNTVHADMMKKLSKEQAAKFAKDLEASIKTV